MEKKMDDYNSTLTTRVDTLENPVKDTRVAILGKDLDKAATDVPPTSQVQDEAVIDVPTSTEVHDRADGTDKVQEKPQISSIGVPDPVVETRALEVPGDFVVDATGATEEAETTDKDTAATSSETQTQMVDPVVDQHIDKEVPVDAATPVVPSIMVDIATTPSNQLQVSPFLRDEPNQLLEGPFPLEDQTDIRVEEL
ncbi:hypothetical protein Pint_30732 [Pistacia integerrima]|uniref:Uncharacterized protein n=1 Tax=Pistacia integerrima TaxID=434235 RepID=A0ACC0X3P6_9ROSI|nr:hypothetical protein Pint_30732 [Pistacia integerrima]